MNAERAFITSASETPKAHIAYNWEFDNQDRRQLESSRHLLATEEFQRRKDQLNARITENLKSEIRERFCTVEYQTAYTLQDGRLVSVHHDEPFSEIIKRGIEYRSQNGSTDTIRERAELIGFERIEQILNHDSEPKTIISISPKGNPNSVYRHNFFDVFQKQEDGKIQMTRFTSTASYEDFQKAAQKLNPVTPQPVTPTDAYFLAHPIETNLSLEEILQTIELDKNALAKEYVESIIEACMPVILAYVANPSEKGYKAAVNLADILAGKKHLSDSVILDPSTTLRVSDLIENPILDRVEDDNRVFKWDQIPSTSYQTPVTINYLASLPVRPVATGCGISGSNTNRTEAIRTLLNPWSVADFGLNTSEEDKSDFPCPKCGYTITYGAGIKQCPGCGLEATCA